MVHDARARRVWLVLFVAACDRPADPYRVTVDVAPQIRAFAEETITADEAAAQLVALGPAVVPALAHALGHEPRDVRLKAVEVLATIGVPEGVPVLVRTAAHDADDEVRADALRALGTIGDPRGRAPVEAALDDARPMLRGAAVMACATLCTTPAAIERLAAIAVRDPDPSIARAARASLGAQDAVDQVRRAVDANRPERLPADATPDQRALAALLASDTDGAAAVPSLVAPLAAASPPVQRLVAWRLGELGDARAVPALRALLPGPDRDVGRYAADALAKLGEPDVRTGPPLGPPEY